MRKALIAIMNPLHRAPARRFHGRASARIGRPCWAVFVSAVWALTLIGPMPARAAPIFAIEGRYDELDAFVLAEDAWGPVTALDVLLFLDMARSPIASVPSEVWLAPEEERDAEAWTYIKSATELYLATRSLAAGVSPPPIPEFLRRIYLYSTAEIVWIESTVKPEIRVDPTDVNAYYIKHSAEYFDPERVQTRHIYIPIADMTDLDQQREAEGRLNAIRARIVDGELAFSEAGRQFSKSPSAARGGLTPAFGPGERFAEFEYQAFGLEKPGDLSPVFIGNEGAYLAQLVSRIEQTRIDVDEVRGEIEDTLVLEHVRSYYRVLSTRLHEKTYSSNWGALWQYADLETPVAIVGPTRLTRDQLIRANPDVINAGYEVQWEVILKEVAAWLEGELILRDLEERGLTSHPYFEKARRIYESIVASQVALDRRVDWSEVATIEAALAVFGRGKSGASGVDAIPQSRVIAISLLPDDEAVADFVRRDLVLETMRQLQRTVARGSLPTRPEPTPFRRPLVEAAAEDDDALERAINRLSRELRGSPHTDVEIRVRDLGWKDSLPGLAWHPAIASLAPGDMTGAQPIGESRNFYLVVNVREKTDSPWLKSPLALQTAAFEIKRLGFLLEETARIQSAGMLRFRVRGLTE